jgi:hypothetical protein
MDFSRIEAKLLMEIEKIKAEIKEKRDMIKNQDDIIS